MNYEQAFAKLLNHGNLVAFEASNLPYEESFVFILWKAEIDKSAPVLKALYEDILSCLEIVNHQVNGQTPSETPAGEKHQLDRRLVNAMWYVAHSGWERYRRWEQGNMFDQVARDDLAITLWRISSAWGAVLDGDIDSITEHVCNEEITTS